MNKQEIGKVTVSYVRGEISDVEFTTKVGMHDAISRHHEIIKEHLEKNDKVELEKAAQFILANVFNKITEVELRDFDTTKIETTVHCNEEDDIVTECIITYYLVEE